MRAGSRAGSGGDAALAGVTLGSEGADSAGRGLSPVLGSDASWR